jgi:hypothetical protein
MNRRLFVIAAAAISLVALAAQAASPDAEPLVGLWKAKRWFSAPMHATVIIQRSGDAFTADVDGRVVPVTTHGR